MARSRTIARSALRRFAPVAFRQARKARSGLLPAAELTRPIRLMFQDLGGTFMKFGQLVASSPGLFSDEIADEFRSCLDTGPAVDFATVRERIEEDLGMSLSDAFAEFDPRPIGRASIAVVHRAKLHDGSDVAVKILRPGIERLVATDLDLMEPFFNLLARQTGEQMIGSFLQLLDGFRVQIGEELDLRNEARFLEMFRSLLDEVGETQNLIAVPQPYPEFSGPNVLTMEFFDGVPIDDLAKVAELGYDPVPVVEAVIRGFFTTAVRFGAFHGDVHAGNMLLLRDGRLGVIDWGIVGRLDPATHRFLVRLLEAVLGDESAWDDVAMYLNRTYGDAIAQGLGLNEEQLSAFMRSMIEPILMRPFGEVSIGQLLQQPQIEMARAQGNQAQQLSVRSIVRRLRFQRRLRAMAEKSGGLMSDFERGAFLLGKQLMYFERYGKLFLTDIPIMNDRVFIQGLINDWNAQQVGGPPGG